MRSISLKSGVRGVNVGRYIRIFCGIAFAVDEDQGVVGAHAADHDGIAGHPALARLTLLAAGAERTLAAPMRSRSSWVQTSTAWGYGLYLFFGLGRRDHDVF